MSKKVSKLKFKNHHIRIFNTILATVLVLIAFQDFSTKNRSRIQKRNRDYVMDCSVQTAGRIDEIFSEGSNSIRVIADFYGRTLNRPEEIDLDYMKNLASETLFDYIEFADKNGNNHNITGKTTDASDRAYYRRGIKGENGLEIVFNSRATNETLMMFYSPLKVKGSIEGVMIGVYSAEKRLEKLLNVEYFGEKANTYLCMEDGRVVACNDHQRHKGENHVSNIVELANGDVELKTMLENALFSGTGISFPYDNNRTSGCLVTMPNSGWHIMQVFPREAGERMVANANRVGLRLEITLLSISSLLLLYFIISFRKDHGNLLEAAENQRKQFNLIHETLTSGMWRIDFDTNGNISDVEWSEEFRKMLGFDREEEFPNNIHSWSDRIFEDDKDSVMKSFFDTINDYTGQETFDAEYRLSVKNGELRWFHSAGRLSRRSSGTPETFVGVFVDITGEKLQHSKVIELEKASFHDKLTGLFNRAAFEAESEKLIHSANLENVAVVNCDVNSLKKVNDELGHAAGDELIKGAAQCIARGFEKHGKCFRIGGDEFVVLVEEHVEDLDMMLGKFRDAQESWHGTLVDSIAISVGVAVSRENPTATIAGLMKIADEKMYENKKAYYRLHDRRKIPEEQ